MLLNLLDHHHELFLAAIRPLICRKFTPELAALGATCRQLRTFLAAEVPLLAHMRKFRAIVNVINEIERLICIDEDDNLTSVTHMQNGIVCYVLYNWDMVLSVYNDNSDYDTILDISYEPIKRLNLGHIDIMQLRGPILNLFAYYGDLCDTKETILDVKLNL
jgi:hypothetical protein